MTVLTREDIRRVDLGYFIRPADETPERRPRVTVAHGYLVRHSEGILMFDTGIGVDEPEAEARYQSVRRPLPEAVERAGARVDEITLVVNCHLHLDHCGGNPLLAGRPIFTQRAEYDEARSVPGYTPAELVDFPGATYELLDGDVEILPGVQVIPTPGHTIGHQSLAVRCGDGTVILAGQSHETASAYAADQLAWALHREAARVDVPESPTWMASLDRLDPALVLFAHDTAVWEPIGPVRQQPGG
jgi:N-acyl homoserine lactone hydrolase